METTTQANGSLPPPTADEREHSRLLSDLIGTEIKDAGGSIDFERFMQLALYAPGLGYYSGRQQKFGAAGDFVTAPELSPLFAHCLARQCYQILATLPGTCILEAGAGSGVLAAELLPALATMGQLPERYLILELSGELRQRQQTMLAERVPQLIDRIDWIDQPPMAGFTGIVLANEVLDAMPVRRFVQTPAGLRQSGVTWADNRFAWCEHPADDAVRQRVEPLKLEHGYTSEINLQAEGWIRRIADGISQGVLLIIDYGFPRNEYYHPDRRQGTLMCHYRHRAHDDPLILVGLQDITAHLDFTALAEAGDDAGLTVMGYTNQASFLLASGLDQILAEAGPVNGSRYLKLAQQAKLLTLPSEMGELFKVIALGKGIDLSLQGFTLTDLRGKL